MRKVILFAAIMLFFACSSNRTVEDSAKEWAKDNKVNFNDMVKANIVSEYKTYYQVKIDGKNKIISCDKNACVETKIYTVTVGR